MNCSDLYLAQFEQDLSTTELAITVSDDVDNLFNLYSKTITELTDNARTATRKSNQIKFTCKHKL